MLIFFILGPPSTEKEVIAGRVAPSRRKFSLLPFFRDILPCSLVAYGNHGHRCMPFRDMENLPGFIRIEPSHLVSHEAKVGSLET